MADTGQEKDRTDELVERIAAAFRTAAVEGRLPASREPLPFLTLAKIAAAVVTTPESADSPVSAAGLRDLKEQK